MAFLIIYKHILAYFTNFTKMFLKILLDKIMQLTILIIDYLKVFEDSPKWLQNIFLNEIR